jgi:hypothetical protein
MLRDYKHSSLYLVELTDLLDEKLQMQKEKTLNLKMHTD